MRQAINIGCSSFDNWQWQGTFYPTDLDRNMFFEYYCQFFSTYEINGTFYKAPTARTLRKWHRDSPSDFKFSVKAPKEITHTNKFENCGKIIDDFYLACENGIREKLGCLLFQFPGSYEYDDSKLDLILESLNYSFNNVIEFRNASWWNRRVYDALISKDVTFCRVSYPGLPEIATPTNRIRYVRMHGINDLFYSEYPETELKGLYESVISEDTSEAYIYFNNTASRAGIRNAMFLSEFAG